MHTATGWCIHTLGLNTIPDHGSGCRLKRHWNESMLVQGLGFVMRGSVQAELVPACVC